MNNMLYRGKQKVNKLGMRRERGIALMLVLWVLTLLSIMVFEFSYTMRIEATIAKNFKEGEKSYYLAQAGINRAIIEIVKTKSTVKKSDESKKSMVGDEEKGETEEEEEESKEWKPSAQPYTFPFEDGECEVKIGDEGGRYNINEIAKKAQRNRKLLTDILEEGCGLEEEERDIIADSIIDWVDKDHNYLLNGAEDDYYESLEDPYECRDGDFVITEELLLVRGVTEEIFYGGKMSFEERDALEEKTEALSPDELELGGVEGTGGRSTGLSKLFTVFSKGTSEKININADPPALMKTKLIVKVKGMTDEMAREVAGKIVELRREEEFENIHDARLIEEVPYYSQIKPYITVDPTNFYRIEARGKVADSSVKRTITAVIELSTRERNKYKILYWQEGV